MFHSCCSVAWQASFTSNIELSGSILQKKFVLPRTKIGIKGCLQISILSKYYSCFPYHNLTSSSQYCLAFSYHIVDSPQKLSANHVPKILLDV